MHLYTVSEFEWRPLNLIVKWTNDSWLYGDLNSLVLQLTSCLKEHLSLSLRVSFLPCRMNIIKLSLQTVVRNAIKNKIFLQFKNPPSKGGKRKKTV